MMYLIISLQVLGIVQSYMLVELRGAGASFPSEVYNEWITLYRSYRFRHKNIAMKYDSVGSGKGKELIKKENPTIHYAGSDTPLSDAERDEHSDLIMFPTLAGAVVIAHNIPDVDELILDLNALVGIYSGKIKKWNDPLLSALNRGLDMPDEDIVPIARADKSGTTNVFTSALSARSREWEDTYGTFSAGYNFKEREPYYWNGTVIKLYGKTNRGISGLMMSIPFSLGYLSIADAYTSELNVALMNNSAGNVVNASVTTVQNAMLSSKDSFAIVNTPGEFAYPIASFTYFIVPKTALTDCDAATEFVRYVNWFLFSESAKSAVTELYMVPLEDKKAEAIVKYHLKTMTCRGNNVWQLVQRQVAEEGILPTNDEWKIPTFLSLALVLVLLIVVGMLCGKQQYKIHKELIKDKWKIPADEIMLERSSDEIQCAGQNDVLSQNSSSKDASKSHIVFIEHAWDDDTVLMGSFNDQPVTLVKLRSQSPILTLKNRRLLLWMRDNVKHNNVMSLFGLSYKNNTYFTVHSGFTRGTLSEVLKNPKIRINKDGIIALMKSLMRGLQYLHKRCVIHGHLTGMCCFIDISWTLKIASWEEMNICKIDDKNRVLSLVDGYSASTDEADKNLLWTAPEILKFNRQPNQASDIYSFSMVLQEMFSKETPYSELNMSVSEVINAILTCGIRPHFAPNTPFAFRNLMERCWDNDPEARTTLSAIESSILNAYPQERPLIDCIFSSVEQYARSLENKIKDIEIDLVNAKEAHELCLYRNVPQHVAEVIKSTGKYDSRLQSNVCILVFKVANISDVMLRVTKKGITNFLNHFYTGIDQLLLQDDICKIQRSGIETSFVVGLQPNALKPRGAVVVAAEIALRLKDFTNKFRNERLQGMDINLKVQIGIASGDVVIGVLDKSKPQLAVFGCVMQQASHIASLSRPGDIFVSEEVYDALQLTGVFKTNPVNKDGEVAYILDGI